MKIRDDTPEIFFKRALTKPDTITDQARHYAEAIFVRFAVGVVGALSASRDVNTAP